MVKLTFENCVTKLGKRVDPAKLDALSLPNKQIDDVGPFGKFEQLETLDLRQITDAERAAAEEWQKSKDAPSVKDPLLNPDAAVEEKRQIEVERVERQKEEKITKEKDLQEKLIRDQKQKEEREAKQKEKNEEEQRTLDEEKKKKKKNVVQQRKKREKKKKSENGRNNRKEKRNKTTN